MELSCWSLAQFSFLFFFSASFFVKKQGLCWQAIGKIAGRKSECFVYITEVSLKGNEERPREPHRQLTMSEFRLKETRGLDKLYSEFTLLKRVPKSLFIFLDSCFFLFFWMDVYFFLLFQTVALSPGFVPVSVGSLNILLYFTLGILHLFFHFANKLSQFCGHFNCQGFEFSVR